ncbi:lysophospholipase-like protein 1 isoform X2 [Planococcus citri]|uniref:lysophospholipase-like protein 1 isoform X2 n=1 Tax=Planococcus citri TaxID=170843 RepID=UPI0031F87D20
MIRLFRTIFWNHLIIQAIIIRDIFCLELEIPSTNHFQNTIDTAHSHPNETHFTHGTFAREEDNILPQEVQTASVIFLHGLGGTGKRTKEAVLFLKRDHKFRHIKMVFPTAPLIPYTPENGNLSRAWFDKTHTDSFSPEDPNTLQKTMKDVKELIQNEMEIGIPLTRIIIGGFSQGGAMALNVAYRNFSENSPNFAGVFALGAYLHGNSSLYEELKGKRLNSNRAPLLFYSHGKKDKKVLYEWGIETFERLKSFGIQGEFRTLGKVEHRISTKGLDQLFEWLERTLP